RLPRMVARWCTRKLFAGRHAPRLRLAGEQPGTKSKNGAKPKPQSGDRKKLAPFNALLKRGRFWAKMREATLLGSVGSVAITFRISDDKKRVAFTVWRAKFCKPSFDEWGDLAQLRISYTAAGRDFKALKIERDADGNPIEDSGNYWFIRDLLP